MKIVSLSRVCGDNVYLNSSFVFLKNEKRNETLNVVWHRVLLGLVYFPGIRETGSVG